MRTALLAAVLLLSLAATTLADDPVEVRLKDGRIVVGEIVAFSAGVYSIRTQTEVVNVAERDIRTIAPSTTPQTSVEIEAPPPASEQWVEPEDRSPEAAGALAEGQSALEAGETDIARLALERARQLDPWSLPTRLALARACEACGDVEAAERELRQVLDVDPTCARGLSALKGLFDRTGQRSKADVLTVEVLRLTCPEPEAEYRSSRHFLANGDLDRACAHWQRYLAIRTSPSPDYDVEARMIAEAGALAAAGQGDRAIARYYDLMQYNPLERETALARVLEIHDATASALLERREVVRACETLDAMATLAPARATSFHERSAAACSQELAHRLEEGDATRLGELLDWLSRRYAAGDASNFVATAVEQAPPEVPGSALAVVHRFLSAHAGPAWALARARLVHALSARVEGTSADAAAAAEALESLDPDRSGEWRARRAEISRSLGLAALSDGNTAIALAHLHAARELLPEDAEVIAAIEKAELEALHQRLAGPCGNAEKESLLQAFLERATNESDAAWGRQELEKVRALSKVECASVRLEREPYFPLDPGTRWVYAWSDGRETEMSIASMDALAGRARIEVSVAARDGDDGGYRPLTLYANDHEIWQERDGRKDVWFRLPVTSGLTWESTIGRMGLRRTYLSTSETVDTRMGTFRNCLKVLYESIDAEGARMTSEMFYAPDVGLVKMTTPGGAGMEIQEFQAGAGKPPSPGPDGKEGD